MFRIITHVHISKNSFDLFVFVQDSSQIELLKELMDLQKDMVVMMLSLLEGRHSDISS